MKLRNLLSRVLMLFPRGRVENDLEAEIRSHLEMQEDDYLRQGIDPQKARQEALRRFGGVDHIESTSRAGLSTITIRLKLNHDSTRALAEVTARLQPVRTELPAEAEPPVVEVQRADRPYAAF